jgi:hypothetical protein
MLWPQTGIGKKLTFLKSPFRLRHASRAGNETLTPARLKNFFLAKCRSECSGEHMRYLRRLFSFLARGRPREFQLELPLCIRKKR